ncbi:phosphatase PAP2 family protein [Streptococcus caviae]|uniref:phosphatase PAP2 family protein n=1 Tax=Streptococcus sp. 'caviae' TaxID=1915004 RepID=UPI00094B90B3|nr:phosphatase PAP2 family protein [Streptococcus sp. 'caviae']OLN83850.1 phosphatase PAP2 family protein [Streptococcus sp. 'caviae']
MKNYAVFYENLTEPIRTRPGLIRLIKWTNSLITKLMPILYLLLLAYLCWSQKTIGALGPYIIIPATAFILLSLVRRILNSPRPYEVWEIQPLITKQTKGQSMPSRHVFSATVISVCVLHETLFLGLVLLLLSLLLALCRVLGGVHYPKDVIAGYLIGLAAGSLLFLL